MKQKIFYLLGALAIVGVLFWAFSPRPLEVETDTLRRERFERSVEDDGWTRVHDRYVVSAPLAGQLARIALREGDSVQRGDIIAQLRAASPTLLDERTVQTQRERIRSLEAQLQAAEAAVERARVSLRQAQSDARRNEQLYERQFISAAQRDTTHLALGLREKEQDSAVHQAEAARHALAEARAVLRDSAYSATAASGITTEPAKSSRASQAIWPVRAPVSGRVLRLPQQSEAVVAIGAPLIEIGDPTRLEVIVDLLTEDAAQVREGMAAQLLNWGGSGALEARVRRIEPSALTKVSALGVEEQRVNVVLDILSPAAQWQMLGDRFRVDVRIPVQVADDALTVPVGALFPQRSRYGLFIVQANRAVLKEVDIVARNGRQAWLRTELHPGTEVILYPPPSLKEGDRVARMKR